MFKRTVQRYGQTPEPVTPYQQAAQLWDERIGSSRVQAKNWRLMAFGSLALSSALACGLIWQSLQSRVVPYVVRVDRLGNAQAVAPATTGYQPDDTEIAYFLAKFVADVRSLSIDPDPVGMFDKASDVAGGYNAMHYYNADAEAIFAKEGQEFDQATRKAELQQWAEIANDDLPYLFCAVRQEVWGVSSKFTGFDKMGPYYNWVACLDEVHPASK